jgi:hypothetical protein
MTLNYQKVWESMNDLETISSKICSAREILDSAIESLESRNREKTETLLYAVDEFLQYYLNDFDEKFKVAWNETVVKLKQEEFSWNSLTGEVSKCDKDDQSPECKGAWTSFWGENYYPEEYSSSQYTEEELNAMCDAAEELEKHSSSYYDYQRNDLEKPNPFTKKDKVVRWRLPVEEVENGDTGEQEYFITFPDDLLEAVNLSEGDEVEWVDRNDGTFILRKVTKPIKMDEC